MLNRHFSVAALGKETRFYVAALGKFPCSREFFVGVLFGVAAPSAIGCESGHADAGETRVVRPALASLAKFGERPPLQAYCEEMCARAAACGVTAAAEQLATNRHYEAAILELQDAVPHDVAACVAACTADAPASGDGERLLRRANACLGTTGCSAFGECLASLAIP